VSITACDIDFHTARRFLADLTLHQFFYFPLFTNVSFTHSRVVNSSACTRQLLRCGCQPHLTDSLVFTCTERF
jgi:hypothetical protein